jgi:hypothetical protein
MPNPNAGTTPKDGGQAEKAKKKLKKKLDPAPMVDDRNYVQNPNVDMEHGTEATRGGAGQD